MEPKMQRGPGMIGLCTVAAHGLWTSMHELICLLRSGRVDLQTRLVPPDLDPACV